MYTANNQLGIFEREEKPSNPLLANDEDDSKEDTSAMKGKDHNDGETLQDIWLRYLTKRYRAVKYYSKEQVKWFTSKQRSYDVVPTLWTLYRRCMDVV